MIFPDKIEQTYVFDDIVEVSEVSDKRLGRRASQSQFFAEFVKFSLWSAPYNYIESSTTKHSQNPVDNYCKDSNREQEHSDHSEMQISIEIKTKMLKKRFRKNENRSDSL